MFTNQNTLYIFDSLKRITSSESLVHESDYTGRIVCCYCVQPARLTQQKDISYHYVVVFIAPHSIQTKNLHYFPVYIVTLPVCSIADLFVLLELITDHLQELVGVCTEILHQTH